jgi:putative heme-binding domain-containing protein
LFVQNEDTSHLPAQVDRRSFHQLLRADQPPPLSPQRTLQSIQVHPGFRVELVAQEPLTMDPVAFEWDERGRLWVAEMGDYPLGMDGQGKPGGVIRFLEDTEETSTALREELLSLAVALQKDSALAQPLAGIAQPTQFAPWQFKSLAVFLDALDRRQLTLAEFQAQAGPKTKAALQQANALFTAARSLADSKSEISNFKSDLLPAISLLGRGLDQQSEDMERLATLLKPQVPPAVQQTALQTLGRLGQARTADLLMAGWWECSPALRVEVLNILFSRADWLDQFLTAVEEERIPTTQIDPAHQQTLLTHAQPEVRERAQELFAAALSDREQIVQAYQEVMKLKGDPDRGQPFFKEHCGTCHKFQGQGVAIGADLGTMVDKPIDYLVTAILDPNRAVEARFISYTAVTGDEFEYSGIITAESPNSITLRNATGETTLLRTDLQSLTSSSLSLMPEGFESAFPPQDLADLIAFIRSR